MTESTFHKMSNNEYVSPGSLVRISVALECRLDDFAKRETE